jgi:hypothetical protein
LTLQNSGVNAKTDREREKERKRQIERKKNQERQRDIHIERWSKREIQQGESQ